MGFLPQVIWGRIFRSPIRQWIVLHLLSGLRAAGCLIYKRDLKRAYRQFPVDPRDYPSLGYCGDLEKLAEFCNEQLVKVVEKKIPMLHSLVSTSFPRNKKVKNLLNKEALIVATFLNAWMPIFNFTFQNNTILVLGGCKMEEMDCFSKLGLSSHPNTLRNMGGKMRQ